ncbi:MAG: hypothetical protein RXS23_04255 [Metallosphaera yellowstonensis]|jgi:hypothetical protein|uniref:Uncharacterized protein n=1 Tax=Metallosphaera yellowstonensis MK1 TaxID=671065 RepID=H2C7N5_9CREN|nr:hypothetical protein [Metallosphaera yellowstonensis]EHP68161.1 hypothetical protein MetMK1DRAFT_00025840 [Metallosphaera yellowstonensis MK1]
MIKYAEYVRHSMTEPILMIYVYKKVEDGKVVSAFRINVYRNMAVAVYEDDKLQGGEVLDVFPGTLDHIVRTVNRYYQKETDDLIIYGEKTLVDSLLDRLED